MEQYFVQMYTQNLILQERENKITKETFSIKLKSEKKGKYEFQQKTIES